MITKRILIAEDNLFYANLLRNRLETVAQVFVEHVANGHACITQAHRQPDIIFLDYKLPDITGIDVLKDIKSTYPQIHIIMLSGQEKINIAVNSLKYGATDYLIKGKDDSPDDLNRIIQNCSMIKLKPKKVPKKNKFINLFKEIFK